MANDLLNCPFCSGEASDAGVVRYGEKHVKDQGWSQSEFYFCNCPACGASNQGIVGHRSRQDAIAAWNRRALSALPADLAGLVDDALTVADRQMVNAYTAGMNGENFDMLAAKAALTSALEALAARQVAVTDAINTVREKGIRIEREANAFQDVGASLEAKIRIKVCDEILSALDLTAAHPAPQAAEEPVEGQKVMISGFRDDRKYRWNRDHYVDDGPRDTSPASGKVEAEAVEMVSEVMRQHIGEYDKPIGTGGCPRIDWYTLRNELVIALEAIVAAMQAENERLRQDRDEALGHAEAAMDDFKAAEAERAKLREGLEPFVGYAADNLAHFPDRGERLSHAVLDEMPISDWFHDARALLKRETES